MFDFLARHAALLRLAGSLAIFRVGSSGDQGWLSYAHGSHVVDRANGHFWCCLRVCGRVAADDTRDSPGPLALVHYS